MIPYQTMLSYDPKKLACHSYPAWKVIALDWVARLLGIHIKIDGVPYGADYKADFHGENCDGGATP
ncbi:hypothetical protein O8B39_17375 [Agrobacterium rhizogenes]|nr:hypothetical protein [Rhizobium rhizogenes]